MTRPDHEINAYLEGELTPKQARALEAWINVDPANAAAFLYLVRTHQMLGIVGKERKQAHEAAHIKPEQLDLVTLASLAEMEAAAEPLPSHETDQPFAFQPAHPRPSRNEVSLIQALDDLRWAAGKVAVRLIRTPLGMTAAIAAVLVLGLFLVAPWQTETPAPLADQQDTQTTPPNKPADSAQPIPRGSESQAVATLTATHNAQWSNTPAERALARGSELHPGTRLTLTAGFAQITTARGAIAIIEAPTTIELLDNNNALHLHTGKLVGICETPSSKGFLVRTPHLDIIDLGTRFGVEVSQTGITTAVYEGSVRLSNSAGTNQLLVADQTATWPLDDRRLSLTVEDRLTDRFDTLLDNPLLAAHASLRPQLVGDAIEWLGQAPADLRHKKSQSKKVQVFYERRQVLLKQDLKVDLTPDVPTLMDRLPDTQIDQGQYVDVYLLHFDTSHADALQTGELAVRFDRPIVGVITAGDKLYDTDALLGLPGTQHPVPPDPTLARARGLDRENATIADQIRIDGHTLHLQLALSQYSAFLDQVRVLVRAQTPQQDSQRAGHFPLTN